MRECALDGCERVVKRRGAKYCAPAHRQRAYEKRQLVRHMLDAAIAEIRHAEMVTGQLRALLVGPSGPFDRTGRPS